MYIDEGIYPYISGKQFSKGIQLKLFEKNCETKYRIEILEILVKDKKITFWMFRSSTTYCTKN